MNIIKLSAMATLAMLAFAANSLLCRMALVETAIDPASFTAWRIVSGAATLLIIVAVTQRSFPTRGNWLMALALFVYAAAFSFAYITMSAGAGALVLFGSVQITMLVWGVLKGERLTAPQWLGFLLAVTGLVMLLLPNSAVPALGSALLMALAGVAWGAYSIMGKTAGAPTDATAGNFLRAAPMALLLLVLLAPDMTASFHNTTGILYAVMSGAIASGVGYAIWYSVLPHIAALKAATIQLSVPVIAMIMGWGALQEPITYRMLLSAICVLGGIALVIWVKARR